MHADELAVATRFQRSAEAVLVHDRDAWSTGEL